MRVFILVVLLVVCMTVENLGYSAVATYAYIFENRPLSRNVLF